MKKIISLLVCLVLVFSLSISAFAAGSAKVNSDASADIIKIGDTVIVTVSLSDCAPFKSMALTPNYDKNVFEIVSGEWLLEGATLSDFNGTSAAIAYANAVEKSGAIFKYILKVKDNATLKNTTIKTEAVIKNGATSVDSTASSVTVKVICKNHSFGAWSKADNNNHKHTCSACGTAESSAHTWNSGAITKAATCKETGVKTYTCTVCNATKTETIAKTTNHTFGNWTTTKEATCEEKGSQTRTCSTCSYEETKNIKALGHKFSNPTVTKESTCSEEGIESGKCTRCDKETTNTLPKKEHTFGEAVVVTPATETAVGKQTKTCTICNTVVEEEIPMIDKNDAETNVEPNDTVDVDNATDSSENNDSNWIIWVIIGSIIIVGGVVIIFIIKKKKSNN